MGWKGFKDFQTTIVIDLDKFEEELYNSFNKDTRYCIRKSKNYNLGFQESDNWEDFYPIYERVMENGGVKPKTMNYLLSRDDYRLFLVTYNQKIIGGLVTSDMMRENKIGLSIATINPEYNKTYAGYFAYWNLILLVKREGFKTFDMGGYKINARGKLKDINLFKKKWGGEIIEYIIYIKNPVRLIGRKIKRFLHL